ncbi:beta-phosphoglucomutase [Thermogemmatispora aurantia]|jgi:beta-phosphoglucomutase|uniref:Beta-phosphoglucomutase n=1 Tax=Thermogemmatispora aurantia TaxID=2045279 RepID=A0A5J4K9B5_9CHLR|nr:HAD family phosphatase [Thermogemmatispora aurantia]GER83672.1 beta-phosphoglucomutase [Thermogemmatispora aurantia]
MAEQGLRAVIWDLDGVIIDSAQAHFRAWQRLAQEEGWRLSEEEFRATFGMRNDRIIPLLWGEMPPERIRALSERKEAYFRELVRQNPQSLALPGALELLQAVHEAGIAQALASSTPPENIALISELLGLQRYLQVLISGEMVERGKPAPDIFLKAAEALQVPPSACVVIEDAVAGIEAAHAAGMRCLAVATTREPEALYEADLVVRSLSEVNVERLRALIPAS